MFTRFRGPRPRRTAPLAGALASVAAHAALVAAAIHADVAGRPDHLANDGRHDGPRDGRGSGEGVRWIGGIGGTGDARAPRLGERLPIAYAVPGRGPLRVAAPAPRRGRPGAREPRGDARADPPPARMRVASPRPAPRQASLPSIPPLADLDAALLVPGVLSSAPDMDRVASRPDEFTRLARPAIDADALARLDIDAPERLRTIGSVDILPIPLVGNARPSYPPTLAQARVGGRVLVEFRIDSAGAVDVASLRVIHTTNALFTQAVQAVLPGLRFLPAQLGRHAVDVTVRQPFVFRVRTGL